ncbi:MAG: PilN domain-containing protein [Bryobacteraceae bacterium]|jgi:Tfp pilus assembly protein PilN
MTAPETEVPTPAASAPPAAATPGTSPLRRMLVFGAGFGIAIGARNLEVVIVRSRASGPRLLGASAIADFRTRPAAEWGAELLGFLSGANAKHLTATVVLPREEVIVRTLKLPRVADKDLQGAIELQIDTLHPWGDEEVAWTWMRADRDRDTILVGLVRKALLGDYETLFSEAGIGLAAVTFSSAVIHAALRIWSAAPASLLCFAISSGHERSRTEVYGESGARAVYSAEFALPPERALAVSRSELRLDPGYPAVSFAEALPPPSVNASESSPLAYAAALAGSAPLTTRFANLLPHERRASNVRKRLWLPAALGTLVLLSLILGFVVLPAIEQRRYLAGLNAEMKRLEPAALRAQSLDRKIAADRAKTAALDDFRRRPQADLDVLNELTRLLPAQVWANSIEIYPDSVVIAGEADQAAPLLKLLDSSPLFQNSEFALSVTHSAQAEQFRIKTMRRNRSGRTTP